jgi:hypothetical protein
MTRSRALLAALVITVLAASGLDFAGVRHDTAEAATTGAGYQDITPFSGYLGNYIAPDGTRVYCIDSAADWPSGATSGATLVSSLTTLSGDALSVAQLRKLNYALRKWGQTANPTTAAAVSAYMYAYTSGYAHSVGQGYAAGAFFINGNSAVLAAYNVIWNESETQYAASSTGSAVVSIVMSNAYDGYVTVSTSPASATGTLTLTGATVVASGLTTAAVVNGSIIPILGNPLDSENKYSISASATFTASGGTGPNLNLYTTGSQQRTVRGGNSSTITFSAFEQVDDPIELVFSPIVGTQVASEFVNPGNAFVDTIVAGVVAGSEVWRQRINGAFFPVVTVGTLYGPFADRPAVAELPPVGAPVVGTETLSLTGPGTYSSAGTLVAPEAGFYTWVWSIDAADQSIFTAEQMPVAYYFADQYGLVAETHIVPIDLAAVSQASTAEIGFSGEVSDQLTVVLESGSWLSDGGVPMTAVFDGVAYFVAGDVPPIESATVPVDAVVLGTATITATGPGVYSASSSVIAPSSTSGYVTWVWQLSSGSADADFFLPWQDLFGLPGETTRVAPPTLGTIALGAVAIGDLAHDTAMVGGQLPAQPSYLVFEAYLQHPDSPVPACDSTNRAFDSSSDPVTVTTEGSYNSPSVGFTEYGTYFWVASLYSFDDQLIHRGVCGEAGETTLVSPAEVTTQAVPAVLLGDLAHDTVTVTGLVPSGATMVFDAYQQTTADPVCVPGTLAFSSAPLEITVAGTFDSPSTRFTEDGTYFWVETLLDRNGNTLHVGTCGEQLETTLVTLSLASTGTPWASALLPLLVGGGMIVLGVVTVAVVGGRRTRNAAAARH